MVKDIYNSEEMKEIITLSQEQNWERGEAISKSSRNVFEAYQKALKEYKEQRAYFSERKMSKAEDKLYKDLIGFKEYLKNKFSYTYDLIENEEEIDTDEYIDIYKGNELNTFI